MTTEQWTITVEFGDGVPGVAFTGNEKKTRLAYKTLLKALNHVVAGDNVSFFEFLIAGRTTSFRLDAVVSVDLQRK